MKAILATFVFVALACEALAAQEQPSVTLKNGKLTGNVGKDRKGNKYYSFQSIPYAKPPVGELRFKAPVPAGPWKGTLDATKTVPTCPQFAMTGGTSGQEDCLYLNVYTPQLKNVSSPKPVMVSIHGGGFYQGSSEPGTYGPGFLLPEDVVLVTFNYRLGFLGFLNSDNPALGISGNNGLKDQVLALKWVQENIKQFGGDPKNVTIFGTSAGGASVHLHMLSPLSKGLFHKAIAQSGTALNIWARGVKNNLQYLLDGLKITTRNATLLLEELRKAPVASIVKLQFSLMIVGLLDQWVVGPVVEDQLKEATFLSEDPLQVIRSGRYNDAPLVLGYNTQEGIFFEVIASGIAGEHILVTEFDEGLPYDLHVKEGHQQQLGKRLEDFYVTQEVLNSTLVLKPTIDFLTDTWFLHYIQQTAEEHARTSKYPVYYYRFSADTQLNLVKNSDKDLLRYPGPSHGDDVCYIHDTSRTPALAPGSIEELSVDRMVALWTNFAKYGNPTPKYDALLLGQIWKPLKAGESLVMDLGNTPGQVANPDWSRIELWKEIYQSYA